MPIPVARISVVAHRLASLASGAALIGLLATMNACGTPEPPKTGTGANEREGTSVPTAQCPQRIAESEMEGAVPWPTGLEEGFGTQPTCFGEPEEGTIAVFWALTSTDATDLLAEISDGLEAGGYVPLNEGEAGEPSEWSVGSGSTAGSVTLRLENDTLVGSSVTLEYPAP